MTFGLKKSGGLQKSGLFCLLLVAAAMPAWAESVPGTKRDLDFDSHMTSLDLDDPRFTLQYKKATLDGSAIGIFIGVGTAPTDRSFVPTNPSSIPEAEVVAYRLSRFLGISRLFYPVDYYQLGPKATAKFRAMVAATGEADDDRAENRRMVLAALRADPNSILGVYRLKPKTRMFTASVLGAQGQFDTGTGLTQEIQAAGRMPDESRIPLAGIKGGRKGFPDVPTEQRVELARQLSTIFVMDMLLGQWDRFWNNLEASGDKSGRLKLIARDNGGATLDDWEGYDTYNRWVSRFDRELIDRLTALHAFLKGEAREFAGYASVDAWKKAVGFLDPASSKVFARKLAMLIDKRIPELVARHGERTFFPPKSAEIVARDAADTGEGD